jgi:hypothetical protein
MSGPTRERLNMLASVARIWARRFAEDFAGDDETGDGADCHDAEAIAALLDSYPLPAGEGEREEVAERLLSGGAQCCEEVYRRAADLLLQPAAGVSVERVVGILNAADDKVRTLRGPLTRGAMVFLFAEMLAAIRALPEAQP